MSTQNVKNIGKIKVPKVLADAFTFLNIPQKIQISELILRKWGTYHAYGTIDVPFDISYEMSKENIKKWEQKNSNLIDTENIMEDEFGEQENSCADYATGFKNSTVVISVQKHIRNELEFFLPEKNKNIDFMSQFNTKFEFYFSDEENNEFRFVNVENGKFFFTIFGDQENLFFRRFGFNLLPAIEKISLRTTNFMANLPMELQELILLKK